MPKLRENLKGAILNQAEPVVDGEREVKIATVEEKREYSKRSPIRKAYEAGQMPIDHQRLLAAIKQELGEGVLEGIIQLEKVLQATGYLRASALKMLHHMQNFGVLETEPKYRATWVKILID
jgi:hypothetical protein